MPLDPDLEEVKDWSGAPAALVAGLNAMVKVINALVRKVGPRGGGSDSGLGDSQEIYVTVADEDGFIRVYKATDQNMTLGTRVDTDEDL